MSQFRNLAFEGGGVKGIAYAGALSVLEQRGILRDIRRVAGTSAGAITATLVALGATSAQVHAIVGGTDFRKFMDDSFGVVRDVNRLLTDFGWYKGDAFAAWMQRQIRELAGDAHLTFGQLAARATAAPGRCRELFIVGSNLTQQRPDVYAAATHPDLPIWQAARISMSIPLFFACVRSGPGREVLVDGGTTWNYPLDLFDNRKFLSRRQAAAPVSGTTYDADHVCNNETLGFRVDTVDEIAAEKAAWQLPPRRIEDFFDYLKALAGFMTDTANRLHLREADWHRTVAIDAAGVSSTDFALADDKVQLLAANGVRDTEAYFRWFDDPASDPAPVNRVGSTRHGVRPSPRARASSRKVDRPRPK